MILKIYIATVIVTIIADVISSLRGKQLLKTYGIKRHKKTVIEILRSVLFSLIVYALPVINIVIAMFVLVVSDETVVGAIKKSEKFYEVGDNE